MSISLVFIISILVFVVMIAGVKPVHKGIVATMAIMVGAIMTTWLAVVSLQGNPYSEVLYGGYIFGNIPVRLDAISSWFVLLTNFTAITGILFGRQYLRHYPCKSADLTLHYASYVLNYAALTGIYFIQNSLAFLCAWEIMALTAFIMVIFEHGKIETLKAGINYLVQSHISIILLTLGFIWVYSKTGSFDFIAIRTYCMTGGNEACLLLFLLFFSGFGIKAGFVPFHTWLPHAHPAAPSHVSGLMSGVMIKSGIYGIFRILLLMPANHLEIGYIVLFFALITGVYGVMLAIIQHNIKRLLAYHSIENIGIIGIGIGIGAIGSGLHNPVMAFAGYAGALLHTLNHSLFKSLLFFSAGNVFQATRTLMIDRMGGIIRKMPYTTLFFLLASLAICGLPPFNGFISEFLIFSGLFNAISANQSASVLVLAVICLVLIGGLAMFCFTKAFGIIFLGTGRHPDHQASHEMGAPTLFPMALIALFIMLIGLFPQIFLSVLHKPVSLFVDIPVMQKTHEFARIMQQISLSAWGLVVLVLFLHFIRRLVARQSISSVNTTWGCGYETGSAKLQYTAGSFVRSYAKLIKPLVVMHKTKDEVGDIIPIPIHSETRYHDKIETGMIDWFIRNLKGFLGRFRFLQNGSVQFYVLYGVVFIGISIAIPLIMNAIHYLAQILKQL